MATNANIAYFDHSILLSRLSGYRVNNIELKLFDSYLSNLQQCLNVGVPQGSCLGPLVCS